MMEQKSRKQRKPNKEIKSLTKDPKQEMQDIHLFPSRTPAPKDPDN